MFTGKTTRRLQRLTPFVMAIGLLAGGSAMLAAPAHAQGTYNNATIATDGLADLGQNPAPGGGQCKAFANAMVKLASSNTQSPSGYQSGWAAAGGIQVSPANAAEGDIIQITPAGSDDADAYSMYVNGHGAKSAQLHTAIIVSNNGNNSFTVVDANFTATNTVGEHYNFNPYTWAAGSIIDIWGMGALNSGGTGGGTNGSSTQMILDAGGNVWAKSTSNVSSSGWTEEVAGGQTAIAAG